MEASKFHELCMAYGKAQEEFTSFERDCHLLAIELVTRFREYLSIPPSQFSLYKINGEGEYEIVPPALINALTLRSDAFWQFGIGITVCSAPETLPQELILIHIQLKKNIEGKFIVKYAKGANEFEIQRDNTSSFTAFFDFLQQSVMRIYNEQFNQFVGQNTKRKLGY